MNVIWDQTLDGGRFRCWVEQNGENGYSGTLRVDVTDTGETILATQVGISYQARFGPDAGDVEEWKQRSLTRVDEWVLERGGGA